MALLKQKISGWAAAFPVFCFLDNNQYPSEPSAYECLAAAGMRDSISAADLTGLDEFMDRYTGCWKFGHLSYDLKTALHPQLTKKDSRFGFPPLFFFVPEIVIVLQNDRLSITAPVPNEVYQQLQAYAVPADDRILPAVALHQRLSKEEYLQKIAALQAHIRYGNCYEINFCQELFAENAMIDPLQTFGQLNQASPTPFAAFYRLHNNYLLCASPERFLYKKGSRILSQPIKGTIKRDLQNGEEDEKLKTALQHSAKDQAENVMIVDLMRNDLSKICEKGSVSWDRLFEVRTYPQVHQMISTITGHLLPQISFAEIIKASFPMGSMTGAPKHRVLQLIDAYEPSARGIFSGSVGYINPAGDFDFNVIIRSLMYNEEMGYLSCQVGSGITIYSDAEQEWEECLLKAKAIKGILSGTN